jgi:hypothetical protein
MYPGLMNIRSSLIVAILKARAAMANTWWTLMGDQADRYRPEAHYMRGPGPRWREKHAQVSARR